MKPELHALWIGGNLSKVEQICLSSFVKHGHIVNLYHYEPITNAPEGVNLIDGNTVVSSDEIYTYPNGSYSAFSNLFRWEVLYQKGGCWIDTDMICMKPFDFNTDIIFGWQDTETINGAVVGFPKGHETPKYLAYLCRNPNTQLPYDKPGHRLRKVIRKYLQGDKRGNIKWGEGGGVQGFSKYIQYNLESEHAMNYLAFYPVHAKCWGALFDGTIKMDSPVISQSYGVHLWNENLRKTSFGKNGPFPEDSFIAQCEKKFLA